MPSHCSPWPAEAWQQARQAFGRGDYVSKRLYSIVISDSSPFSPAEKLQEVSGGPVEVKWVSKETLEEREEDIAHAEKVMICEVNGDQWDRVGEYSSVKQTLLWINGKKRIGWVVREPGCSAED